MLIEFVNIWSIFGHVLGNWAQGLAWEGDLVCHVDLDPRVLLWNAENFVCVNTTRTTGQLGGLASCYKPMSLKSNLAIDHSTCTMRCTQAQLNGRARLRKDCCDRRNLQATKCTKPPEMQNNSNQEHRKHKNESMHNCA